MEHTRNDYAPVEADLQHKEKKSTIRIKFSDIIAEAPSTYRVAVSGFVMKSGTAGQTVSD